MKVVADAAAATAGGKKSQKKKMLKQLVCVCVNVDEMYVCLDV